MSEVIDTLEEIAAVSSKRANTGTARPNRGGRWSHLTERGQLAMHRLKAKQANYFSRKHKRESK